jgi:hydrogenase large subunit
MKIAASFDPVTRIEGHLGVELEFDTVSGVQQVVDVRASGLLFRGIENILIGRDPRDAPLITQRICGVCPVAHGMAAVTALDQACGITVPANARILRNLVNAANFIESHILHFYLLALPDFIAGPALPPWQADWNVDRRFDPKTAEALLGGYLKAVEIRRKGHEMGALFGGKLPHPATYVAGGFTANPRPERIAAFRVYLNELIAFIEDRYVPDAELLAAQYSDYFALGRGHANLLSYGVFDLDDTGTRKLLTGGHVLGGSQDRQAMDAASITEHVTYSWYQNKTTGLNPAAGKTSAVDPASKSAAYSWLKAPRYGGKPCEVGPLARMWINGEYANGISVMDRHLARSKEALKIAQAAQGWLDELVPEGPVYTEPAIPVAATGIGLTEAPRGALGHWLGISDGAIAQYQVITPTTWNASPRDNKGVLGPMEEALLGIPVENSERPVEVMRVIHSFDPCLDCAVH